MNSNRISYLDSVWSAGGTARLKRVFDELARRDMAEAQRLMNDDRLGFPVLFILMQEVSANALFPGLSRRNRTAIGLCAKKIYKQDLEDAAESMDSDSMYQTLKWMFDTGKGWSGPSGGQDPYDSVIDYVAALLIISFEDKAALMDIAALIFRRNRRGFNIHDLVWCFFQTLDRDALAYIAGKMLSDNTRDTALACRLLCQDMPLPSNRSDAKKMYNQYIDWLDENTPFLYLTNEHFQMTSNPKHLDADMEAKYLGKKISPRYRAPVEPLTAYENECLHRYRTASYEEQDLLTDYSSRLRRRDSGLWFEWLQMQTAEQVVAAKMGMEAV